MEEAHKVEQPEPEPNHGSDDPVEDVAAKVEQAVR
jgi:hypothetical protein